MRDERVDEETGEQSPDEPRVPGGIWHSSWGLRLSLGLVALLVWVGAASVPSSPTPATSSSVSPPVTTPVVAPAGPATPAAPSAVDRAPQTANLPTQALDITYDYGPGPQPVPGPSTLP